MSTIIYQQTPNPLFAREKTVVINDGWQFSFDNLTWKKINVPYCPESKLSGIGYTDFIPVCYYKKSFSVQRSEKRIILHFGAVDYKANVYVNDIYIGEHTGGYTPFAFDVTSALKEGENEIFLEVRDSEFGKSATGKQSKRKKSYGCFYTRTTGIWQSVWLEEVPEKYVKEFYFYPSVNDCAVDVDLFVSHSGKYSVEIFFEGRKVGESQGNIDYRSNIRIPLSEKHCWEEGKGNLYDVKIRFEEDEVYSYFGLREVEYKGYDFFLNGKRCYQKLVLDQGYYPDGIYTAPNVAAMQKDIDMALDLGFNGARLHQKVFDPQFLYLCDKAGYLIWGEYASWGIDYSGLDGLGQFLAEWQETLKRDFNHPSIITWCPLNEAWGDWDDPKKERNVKFIDTVYAFTKIFDSTRPCVDVSGGHHGEKTDLFDFHCYEPLENIQKYLDEWEENGVLEVPLLYNKNEDKKYTGGPVNISECGGFSLSDTIGNVDTVNEGAVQSEEAWGYGKGETDSEAFVKRYEELIVLLARYKKLSGFCYTQLYDIEQECNGFYRYDRSDKLTEEQKQRIKKINDIF